MGGSSQPKDEPDQTLKIFLASAVQNRYIELRKVLRDRVPICEKKNVWLYRKVVAERKYKNEHMSKMLVQL